jgi:hypothetical protein
MADQWSDPATWGNRYDKSGPKGAGYFGALQRADGGIMSEYSIPLDEEHGDTREVPTLVPTLTADEVKAVLGAKEGSSLPPSVIKKALAHARQRLAAGQSPFAEPHETNTQQYPQFPRARVTAPGASLMSPSHGNTPPPMLALDQELLLQMMRGGK